MPTGPAARRRTEATSGSEWQGRLKSAPTPLTLSSDRSPIYGIAAEFDRKAKVISEAADAWQTSSRIRDFKMALLKADESKERSKDQGYDIRRVAKWARGYAQRLDPTNRIEQTVAEFKNLQESE